MAHFNFNYIFISVTAVCYSFPVHGNLIRAKTISVLFLTIIIVFWAQHNGWNVMGADYKYIFMVRLPLTEE